MKVKVHFKDHFHSQLSNLFSSRNRFQDQFQDRKKLTFQAHRYSLQAFTEQR